MNENDHIVIPKEPIESTYGDWAFDHPECDSIMQLIGTGPSILVFGYAKDEKGNAELRRYRNEHLPEYRILSGVTKDAVNGLI